MAVESTQESKSKSKVLEHLAPWAPEGYVSLLQGGRLTVAGEISIVDFQGTKLEPVQFQDIRPSKKLAAFAFPGVKGKLPAFVLRSTSEGVFAVIGANTANRQGEGDKDPFIIAAEVKELKVGGKATLQIPTADGGVVDFIPVSNKIAKLKDGWQMAIASKKPNETDAIRPQSKEKPAAATTVAFKKRELEGLNVAGDQTVPAARLDFDTKTYSFLIPPNDQENLKTASAEILDLKFQGDKKDALFWEMLTTSLQNRFQHFEQSMRSGELVFKRTADKTMVLGVEVGGDESAFQNSAFESLLEITGEVEEDELSRILSAALAMYYEYKFKENAETRQKLINTLESLKQEGVAQVPILLPGGYVMALGLEQREGSGHTSDKRLRIYGVYKEGSAVLDKWIPQIVVSGVEELRKKLGVLDQIDEVVRALDLQKEYDLLRDGNIRWHLKPEAYKLGEDDRKYMLVFSIGLNRVGKHNAFVRLEMAPQALLQTEWQTFQDVFAQSQVGVLFEQKIRRSPDKLLIYYTAGPIRIYVRKNESGRAEIERISVNEAEVFKQVYQKDIIALKEDTQRLLRASSLEVTVGSQVRLDSAKVKLNIHVPYVTWGLNVRDGQKEMRVGLQIPTKRFKVSAENVIGRIVYIGGREFLAVAYKKRDNKGRLVIVPAERENKQVFERLGVQFEENNTALGGIIKKLEKQVESMGISPEEVLPKIQQALKELGVDLERAAVLNGHLKISKTQDRKVVVEGKNGANISVLTSEGGVQTLGHLPIAVDPFSNLENYRVVKVGDHALAIVYGKKTQDGNMKGQVILVQGAAAAKMVLALVPGLQELDARSYYVERHRFFKRFIDLPDAVQEAFRFYPRPRLVVDVSSGKAYEVNEDTIPASGRLPIRQEDDARLFKEIELKDSEGTVGSDVNPRVLEAISKVVDSAFNGINLKQLRNLRIFSTGEGKIEVESLLGHAVMQVIVGERLNDGEARKILGYTLKRIVDQARSNSPEAPQAIDKALDHLGVAYLRVGDYILKLSKSIGPDISEATSELHYEPLTLEEGVNQIKKLAEEGKYKEAYKLFEAVAGERLENSVNELGNSPVVWVLEGMHMFAIATPQQTEQQLPELKYVIDLSTIKQVQSKLLQKTGQNWKIDIQLGEDVILEQIFEKISLSQEHSTVVEFLAAIASIEEEIEDMPDYWKKTVYYDKKSGFLFILKPGTDNKNVVLQIVAVPQEHVHSIEDFLQREKKDAILSPGATPERVASDELDEALNNIFSRFSHLKGIRQQLKVRFNKEVGKQELQMFILMREAVRNLLVQQEIMQQLQEVAGKFKNIRSDNSERVEHLLSEAKDVLSEILGQAFYRPGENAILDKDFWMSQIERLITDSRAETANHDALMIMESLYAAFAGDTQMLQQAHIRLVSSLIQANQQDLVEAFELNYPIHLARIEKWLEDEQLMQDFEEYMNLYTRWGAFRRLHGQVLALRNQVQGLQRELAATQGKAGEVLGWLNRLQTIQRYRGNIEELQRVDGGRVEDEQIQKVVNALEGHIQQLLEAKREYLQGSHFGEQPLQQKFGDKLQQLVSVLDQAISQFEQKGADEENQLPTKYQNLCTKIGLACSERLNSVMHYALYHLVKAALEYAKHKDDEHGRRALQVLQNNAYSLQRRKERKNN